MKLNTSHIPELAFFQDWIQQYPDEYQCIQGTYQKIILHLCDMSSSNREIIWESRRLMSERWVKLQSASNFDTAIFIKEIQVNTQEIVDVLEGVFYETEISREVLWRLQAMLEAGSKLARLGSSHIPKDGDTVWDSVIWGHTQARKDVDKKVLVHFFISHYLCQYMNYTLWERYNLKEKDDFINVLADYILLEECLRWPTEIYHIWSKSKQDAWLGWISQEQLAIYKEVVQTWKPQ